MDLTNFNFENKKDTKKYKSNNLIDKNLEINFEEIKKDTKNEKKEFYLPWFLKYQIEKFDDLYKTQEIIELETHIKKKDFRKGILLYGQAGSGKTTTLHLLAKKYDYEVFELNASDSRNKKLIQNELNDVVKKKSLFGKEKLIILDEIDGLSSTKDRGGIVEIVKIIKENNLPFFLTANDFESEKLKPIKKICINLNFENHIKEVLVNLGINILEKEKVKYDKKILENFIDKRNVADIRGFINDLQSNVVNKKFEENENVEVRDYKRALNMFLSGIYYKNPEESLKNSYSDKIGFDELGLYVEENTNKVYNKKENYLAFNEISKADLFRRRIMKWQYWRYLVYVTFYLTYGVSSHKNNPNKITKFKRNTRILKKWIYSMSINNFTPRTKIQKTKGEDFKFIELLAKKYNCSTRKVKKDILPYFKIMYKNNESFKNEIKKELKIDEKTEKQLMVF